MKNMNNSYEIKTKKLESGNGYIYGTVINGCESWGGIDIETYENQIGFKTEGEAIIAGAAYIKREVGGGDGSDVVADIRTDRPEDEVEANAHLIASAPEMLEALKKLAECSKEIPLMKYEQGLVDKAIAHAEGREV